MKTLLKLSHIEFSLCDRFRKMSFQNRCVIPAANGLTTLSIPLRGGRENGLPLAEVGINDQQQWQLRHWRTITSSYNRSPYFEFYEPTLSKIYETHFDKLWEWNLALLKWTCSQLGVEIMLTTTDTPTDLAVKTYDQVLPRNFQQAELIQGYPVYPQVFMEKIGFQPNVSVMDLLFCMGKNSRQLLQTML